MASNIEHLSDCSESHGKLSCNSSETDSASEEVAYFMANSESMSEGKKDQLSSRGECEKIPEVEILHVEPSSVSRHVEIIRVDHPNIECEIEIVKYIPGNFGKSVKDRIQMFQSWVPESRKGSMTWTDKHKSQ